MLKALLVGINTYPTAPLNGCVNDVDDMCKYLKSVHKITSNEIIILKDSQANTENIKHELEKFVSQMVSGGKYLFQYSGHGSQLPEVIKGSETDGLDECICPVDFDFSQKHAITDNYFNDIFAKIPDGAILYWISDSCHSGNLEKSMDRRTRLFPMLRKFAGNKKNKSKSVNKNIVFISGCKDNQTSSDAYFNGKYNGALTYYLLNSMYKYKNESIEKIYKVTKLALRCNGFEQIPQLIGNSDFFNNKFLI